MNEKKDDRRSKRTRRLLSEALIELMLEKRYDKITVQDIIDRADVGRSTFYAHYQDKEDLLAKDFERVLGMLSQQINHGREIKQLILPGLGIFRHVQEHHHLYKALLWGRGIELLFKKGHSYVSRRFEEQLTSLIPDEQVPIVPIPVISDYLAGALLTLLQWWLDNNMPYPPERMDEMFQQLVLPGVMASLQKSV